MATKTIAEYLEELDTDKSTLVDTLVAKGVSADNTMGLTELVGLVDDISGGGISGLHIVDSDAELEELTYPDVNQGDFGLVLDSTVVEDSGNLNVSSNTIKASSLTFPAAGSNEFTTNLYSITGTSSINASGIYSDSGQYNRMQITISPLPLTVNSTVMTIDIFDDNDGYICSAVYDFLNGSQTTSFGFNLNVDASYNIDKTTRTCTSEALKALNFENFILYNGGWQTITTANLFKDITYTYYDKHIDRVRGPYCCSNADQYRSYWYLNNTDLSVNDPSMIDRSTVVPLPNITISNLYQSYYQSVYTHSINLSGTRAYGINSYVFSGYQGYSKVYLCSAEQAFAESYIEEIILADSNQDTNSFFTKADTTQLRTSSSDQYLNEILLLDMRETFSGCSSLKSILGLSVRPNNGYDCMMVDLYRTFYNCDKLETPITISLPSVSWLYNKGATGDLQTLMNSRRTFEGCFYGCTKLPAVRITNYAVGDNPTTGEFGEYINTMASFDTTNMFYGCIGLQVIDFSYLKLYKGMPLFDFRNNTFSDVSSSCTLYVYDSEDANYISQYFSGNIVVGHPNSSVFGD